MLIRIICAFDVPISPVINQISFLRDSLLNIKRPDSPQMALSAASPFYRGFVSDIDCRWGVISASVDDRTQEERGLKVRVAMWCP